MALERTSVKKTIRRLCELSLRFLGKNSNYRLSSSILLMDYFLCSQRDYFRQDQDEVLSTPIAIARKLPEDILRLAGYHKSVGGSGFVEDHQDPVDFLQSNDNGMGKFGVVTDNLAI